jgi:hypothetical protein
MKHLEACQETLNKKCFDLFNIKPFCSARPRSYGSHRLRLPPSNVGLQQVNKSSNIYTMHLGCIIQPEAKSKRQTRMDKKTSAIFCSIYIIITSLTIMEVSYGDCTSRSVVALISSLLGTIAITCFFSSNRNNINSFMKDPSFKKAKKILLIR